MPNKLPQLHIPPNHPVMVCLLDPEGTYDFDLQSGRYETTTGQHLVLPRPAVIALNQIAPAPGEEIQIVKHWTGKPGEPAQWTVALSTRAENARAENEIAAQDLTDTLRASVESVNRQKAAVGAPTPIRTSRKQPSPEVQPRLFDRGTGTYGPAPEPAASPVAAPARHRLPSPIPANVAVREILAFIAADPNTQNWSDQARQDLASTIIIAGYKAGHITLWERPSGVPE